MNDVIHPSFKQDMRDLGIRGAPGQAVCNIIAAFAAAPVIQHRYASNSFYARDPTVFFGKGKALDQRVAEACNSAHNSTVSFKIKR